MEGDVYFDGDPEHDSARRHLERVLKGSPPRRRWPWVLAILGGGAWTAWRMMQSPTRRGPQGANPQGRGSDGLAPDDRNSRSERDPREVRR